MEREREGGREGGREIDREMEDKRPDRSNKTHSINKKNEIYERRQVRN